MIVNNNTFLYPFLEIYFFGFIFRCVGSWVLTLFFSMWLLRICIAPRSWNIAFRCSLCKKDAHMFYWFAIDWFLWKIFNLCLQMVGCKGSDKGGQLIQQQQACRLAWSWYSTPQLHCMPKIKNLGFSQNHQNWKLGFSMTKFRFL